MIENNSVFRAFEKARRKQKYDYAYILRTAFCRAQNKREAAQPLFCSIRFLEYLILIILFGDVTTLDAGLRVW